MIDVKKSLKKIRIDLGLNQEEFAKLLQISVSTYRRKESGETQLNLEELYKISKLINKSIDEIFFDNCVPKLEYI